MRQTYQPSDNILLHRNYHLKEKTQAYLNARRTLHKQYATSYNQDTVVNESRAYRQAQGSSVPTNSPVSYDGRLNHEKSQLPHYVVPVLYTPKRVVKSDELCKDRTLRNLFKEKSYEKVCQGVPVTTVEGNKVAPDKNYNLKQTTSTNLSQSETEVYNRLMKNIYGIKMDSQGDYSWCKRSKRKPNQTTNPGNQKAANRSNEMYLEADQHYSNPNYHFYSDSDNSCLSVSQAYPHRRPVRRIHAAKEHDPPSTLVHPGNPPENAYTNYAQARSRYAQVYSAQNGHQKAMKSAVMRQKQDLYNLECSVVEAAESRSTQTFMEDSVVSATKETQTTHCHRCKYHRSCFDQEKNCTKKGAKSDCNDPNITVIIDRGWKEDVYSIPAVSSFPDTPVLTSKSTTTRPVVDLLPVAPISTQSCDKNLDQLNLTNQRSTRNSATNTNITLKQFKQKFLSSH